MLFKQQSLTTYIVPTTCSRLMNEQWLLQHDGTSVNKVDETCLINVVRTMLFSVVHSSGVNNIVRTGVNNIDERTSCF
jgi:hypothetical protein